MNISLTWATYALIVSVCLGVYYPIALLFYRKKISRLLVKNTSEAKLPSTSLGNDEETSVKSKNVNLFEEEMEEHKLNLADEDNDFKPEAQDFADEIEAYTSSCTDEVDKEELIESLRKIIQKYPSLISSEARYELSQLIAISTENNCSIHLSADELSELWNG